MPRKSLIDRLADALVTLLPTMPDPRSLKPGPLCRLLNSTPLGQVLTDRRLRAHREAAGLRIGDGKTIDLFRYAAWLFQRSRPEASTATSGESLTGYDRKRERERARNAVAAAEGAEIGELPAVVDRRRRETGRTNFRAFCETYLPYRFPLAWSPDHLQVIQRIETAVLEGGLFALAMPRGSGKTTLCEAACLWAALYGHHQFIALVGATMTAAQEMLDSIKTEVETNPLLAEDFPEVCVPVAHIEGSPSRQNKQTHNGERTRMRWSGRESIVLPTIAGSAASGVIVKCSGLTGRLRGMKHARADGEQARPSLAVVDDPQTDRTSKNPLVVKERLKIINGTVLRGVGPGKTMSGLCPCTVIRPGDLAAQLLDRNLQPKWQGERFQALYAFPADMDRWHEYAAVRADELRNGGDGSQANAFYRKHRKAMDAGAVVAWPQRFEAKELSAIQHCLNVFFDDPALFAAEYQNAPLAEDCGNEQLDAEAIAVRTNNIGRGVVPSWCEHLVCYCDVQQDSLWWLVAGFDNRFSGAVVDYGVFPEQKTRFPQKKSLDATLKQLFPRAGIEGQIRGGLDRLATDLLGRDWRRDGGGVQRIERMLIDRGFKTTVVDRFCREHVHATILTPAKGRGIGAKKAPMNLFKRRPGERLGEHWILKKEGPVRWCDIDTHHWKSFVAARLQVAIGDPGALTLFGRQPHKLLAEHCTAESFTRVEAEGRVVEEWDLEPTRPDNEWWDCLVGCHVAASMQGVVLAELMPKPTARRKRPPRQAEYL